MTTIFKQEEIITSSGKVMFIEQYAEKPYFVKFWRYGADGIIYNDQLRSKPNKKRLIKKY